MKGSNFSVPMSDMKNPCTLDCTLNKQKTQDTVLDLHIRACRRDYLMVCVLSCKNTIFRSVKIVLNEVFAFA